MEKILKRYVIENIEKFCDTDSLDQIENIAFWDLEYWCDFRIDYLNGNWDWYTYERNVMPLIKNIIINTNHDNNTVVIWWVEYPPTSHNLNVVKRYKIEKDIQVLKNLSDVVLTFKA